MRFEVRVPERGRWNQNRVGLRTHLPSEPSGTPNPVGLRTQLDSEPRCHLNRVASRIQRESVGLDQEQPSESGVGSTSAVG